MFVHFHNVLIGQLQWDPQGLLMEARILNKIWNLLHWNMKPIFHMSLSNPFVSPCLVSVISIFMLVFWSWMQCFFSNGVCHWLLLFVCNILLELYLIWNLKINSAFYLFVLFGNAKKPLYETTIGSNDHKMSWQKYWKQDM